MVSQKTPQRGGAQQHKCPPAIAAAEWYGRRAIQHQVVVADDGDADRSEREGEVLGRVRGGAVGDDEGAAGEGVGLGSDGGVGGGVVRDGRGGVHQAGEGPACSSTGGTAGGKKKNKKIL